MIAHDVEIIKNGVKYRVSDNPHTYKHLRVLDYNVIGLGYKRNYSCLLYTSPSPRDMRRSRMPSSA
ncbi:hypothetical protein JMUB7525_27300 [Staphylococcus aureus]